MNSMYNHQENDFNVKAPPYMLCSVESNQIKSLFSQDSEKLLGIDLQLFVSAMPDLLLRENEIPSQLILIMSLLCDV